MRTALVALVLAFSQPAHAEEAVFGGSAQPLLQVTNDRDSVVDIFGIQSEGGVAQALVRESNQPNDRGDVFPLAQLASPQGAVFLSGQGHDVLIVQGSLDRNQEGRFHAKYLTNGLTNQYSTCDFLVKRNSAGWFVQNAYTGKIVTEMKIITWSLGLKTLQGLCP